MTTWEYKSAPIFKADDVGDVARRMNAEGSHGWEVIHMDARNIWFKRPLPKDRRSR